MNEKYVGILKDNDPLFFYLNKMKQLKLQNFTPTDFYLVYLLNAKNVYKYTSNFDGTSFVVKFFGQSGTINKKIAEKRLLWEFTKLKYFQICTTKQIKVINPYCYLIDIDCALVEPYIKGKTLDHYIKKLTQQNNKEKLKKKLYLLALLLNCIHKSHKTENYDFSVEKNYCSKILHTLYQSSLIDKYQLMQVKQMCNEKLQSKTVASNIHGDATTTNFLYSNGSIYAIDMEKSKIASFKLDLGFIVAELKHHFMLFDLKDDVFSFISYFLSSYSALSGINLNEIEHNLETFIALGLLRIARNEYLKYTYRRLLFDEAILLLK